LAALQQLDAAIGFQAMIVSDDVEHSQKIFSRRY